MKHKITICILFLTFCSALLIQDKARAGNKAEDKAEKKNSEKPASSKWPFITKAQQNRDERMAWWRDAKFGMFIHWGVYAIPAGIWKGKEYDGIGEWIMSHADIPKEEYEKLPPKFKPVKFDAEQWVQTAKNAGMKYMVITSKHHDGFCMFDSKATDYDIVDATPYGKDVLKPLSNECEKAGIKFCTYYSILDWHHPAQKLRVDNGRHNYGNNQIKKDRKQECIEYVKAHLKELVNNYDISLLWFDGGWMSWWKAKDGKEIVDYLWSISPDIIINNRATGKAKKHIADYGTPEQKIPRKGSERDFETCMTMNDTWGFKKNDHNWKSTKTLLVNLVDIVSKGGNYLLNVGPTPQGVIPQPSVERLNEIGDWLKINGEAIYSTTRWKVYREIPPAEKSKNFANVELRFTAKENAVYAACLSWPEKTVKIKSIGKQSFPKIKVKNVKMLGSDQQLQWTQHANFLTIKPPKTKPCDYVCVFKVILE